MRMKALTNVNMRTPPNLRSLREEKRNTQRVRRSQSILVTFRFSNRARICGYPRAAGIGENVERQLVEEAGDKTEGVF